MVCAGRRMAVARTPPMATLDGFIEEWRSDVPYIEAHTSGSTGKPKNIRLPKTDMESSAMATNSFFGLGKGSIAALPLSTDYIAGKMMLVRAIIGGYDVVPLPVSNEICLPDDTTMFDIMPVVPSQLDSLLRHPEYSRQIRNLLIGGASPDPDTCHRLRKSGYKAYISYGMTETCSHVALAHAEDPERVFHAMPGISFETDADGRLIICAPHFSFGRLTTNDIVELRSADSFCWRGRFDNVINSGGIKLYPEELERLYSPYLQGTNFYVAGRSDSRWGQAVAIVVEGQVNEDEIMQTLRDNLPHKLCPKSIETVEVLPRTENGKIRRI